MSPLVCLPPYSVRMPAAAKAARMDFEVSAGNGDVVDVKVGGVGERSDGEQGGGEFANQHGLLNIICSCSK